MPKIFTSNVSVDHFTNTVSNAFDYAFDGTSTFIGWDKPKIDFEYGIGLIIGPSGSGKSLLLKEFGTEKKVSWNKNKAIISHFETPEIGISKLTSVGLNSIPSWCKPFHVLSNGEQFRANLARRLESNTVIDEFTSVIDRNVAKSTSVAMKRYITNNNLKNIVLASCHYDILDWLRPDWFFDTSTGIFEDGRLLQRPKIEIKIYPCKRYIWSMFKNHHYLTSKLNNTCRSFLCTTNFGSGEVPVGFVSSITFPSGTLKNAYREHRTVVLPDYQGLGIGPRISDTVAQIHIDEGKRYFSRTAHPRFGAYRDASPLWKQTSKYKLKRVDQRMDKMTKWLPDGRICYSHEYIGLRSKNFFDEFYT